VASKAPLRIDVSRLARRMSHPRTRQDLEEVFLDEPATLLGYFIAGDDALEELVRGTPWLNTDDLPLLEYELPLYTRSAVLENVKEMVRIQESVLPLLENVSDRQKEQILVCGQSNALLCRALIRLFEGQPELALAACREALQRNPENRDAKELLPRIDARLRSR
jgi:hypothetical protein